MYEYMENDRHSAASKAASHFDKALQRMAGPRKVVKGHVRALALRPTPMLWQILQKPCGCASRSSDSLTPLNSNPATSWKGGHSCPGGVFHAHAVPREQSPSESVRIQRRGFEQVVPRGCCRHGKACAAKTSESWMGFPAQHSPKNAAANPAKAHPSGRRQAQSGRRQAQKSPTCTLSSNQSVLDCLDDPDSQLSPELAQWLASCARDSTYAQIRTYLEVSAHMWCIENRPALSWQAKLPLTV